MKILEFEFKDDRNYVHGPDIFNKAYTEAKAELGSSLDTVKLSCRAMANTNLYFSTKFYSEREIMSIFEVTNSKNKIKYYLYSADSVIDKSKPYHESDIVKNSVFDHQKKIANIKNYSRYSISEVSVALLKELCKHIISNDVKWVFVGLDVKSPMELYTESNIEVKIEKNIGTKMVVARVKVGTEVIGNMKFSSYGK
ncbi:MAG: hypothetical protein ABJR05_10035 [Balneola sp.]